MTLQELFASEASWTQKAMARDETGKPVETLNKDAVCWCFFSSIYKCYGYNGEGLLVLRRIREHLKLEKMSPLVDWNDHPDRTIDDIRVICKELNV